MLNRRYTGPLGLWSWCKLVIAASYPADQEASALIEAADYISWLDSLPVLACDIGRSGE